MSASAVTHAAYALLAQDDILRGLRSGLSSEPSAGQWLVFVLCAVGLVVLLAVLKRYFSREEVHRRPARTDYLAQAARALDLSHQQREDLARLATRARLPEPAALLLSPANLAYGISRAFTDGQEPALRARLDELSRDLFGQPLPPPPNAKSHA